MSGKDNYFNQSRDQVLQHFGVSKESGLSSEEAAKRLEKYGANQLISKKKRSFLLLILAQFKSFMILILIMAAIVSAVTGIINGEGILESLVIIGILIVNALIGAIQEKKAESSLAALQNMSAPHSKVLRNGAVLEISTKEVVPGDIVILETGDIIPADIRLINTVNLKIQESAMTGESLPVEKHSEQLLNTDVVIGDMTNMAFTGGMVTYGRGEGVVVATSMDTEVGRIAKMIQQTDNTETPMKIRLEKLGKMLGIAALVICLLIFGIGILYGNPLLSMFMTAVSLAVAAIPEGLPAISTIVLAIGVQRLVKQNAIIRTLPSVETLGSATVICSDKTGTLTQNKMTVVEKFSINNDEQKLLKIAILCADAHLTKSEDGTYKTTGDPTETALLDIGIKHDLDKNILEKEFPRVAEIPFDSERKRMTTVNLIRENLYAVNMKGGVDEVLSVCNIAPEEIVKISEINEKMGSSALRVLALAYKEIETLPSEITIETLEKEMTFAGLVGMIDPARPEVIEAVQKCKNAGIKVVMITGDHKITAMAIAKEIGIYTDKNIAVTGTELEKMTTDTLFEKVREITVYARVAPEHKVRIVQAWQNNGEIVAMTGDGVNDAPALKQADIGAAMGIVGTDVAKEASDMILTDDNFATIVTAVEEGRRIYDNILKTIQFLLSTNVGEILLIFSASILNWGTPLLPIHILWVNLVTDSLPALALSVDPAEKDIMSRDPRNPKNGLMSKGMIWRVIYQGIILGIIPLIAYRIGIRDGGESLGQTMAFTALILAQLVHVRNLHSNKVSSFRTNPLRNKYLLGAIILSAAMMLAVLLIQPFREAFKFSIMDTSHWILVVSMSFIPTVVVELFKLFKINGTN